MNIRLVSFPYFGGKTIHLNWLLPKLPYTRIYVEPFGGSAAVLLNREPSEVEVYNDLNGSLVNFFKMLREHRDELLDLLDNTLYSRQEFNQALAFLHDPERRERPLEWARCFYVVTRQSYMADGGNWVMTKIDSSRVTIWRRSLDMLQRVAERFKHVYIENTDGIRLIEKFDYEEAMIYEDPPYVLSTRGETGRYDCEMTDEQHRDLAEVNHSLRAKIAISGYRCELYDELYADWTRVDMDYNLGGGLGTRTESIWCNYDPYKVRHYEQMSIDEFL